MKSRSQAPGHATASARNGETIAAVLPTSAGWVGCAATARGLTRLTLPQRSWTQAWRRLGVSAPNGISLGPVSKDLQQRLDRYFAGKPEIFRDIPLDLRGVSPFTRRVLMAVRAIPRGQVRSYRQVAAAVGRPQAARAVGRVMAANSLCIVVPCHRVVGSNGSLGGFGGGLDLKRRLLTLEGAPLD